MAVVLGTSSGFVTSAPVDNPGGSAQAQSAYSNATKDTSPATAIRVTELGFFVSFSTDTVDAQVGLYDHDSGNDKPDNYLGGSLTESINEDDNVWYNITGLNIVITAETVYWIAVQADTSSGLNTDVSWDTGERICVISASSALPDPWNNGGSSSANYILAYYALWSDEAAPGGSAGLQINIGDTWKAVEGIQINIGDVWKVVSAAQINIGDDWKEAY